MTTIRQANHSDIDQLTSLFDQYRVFYGKASDQSSARAFLEQRLTNADSVIFVAAEGSTLKGFTQLYPLFSSVRMKKLWLLNDLYVHEKHRGQGLSVALIDEAKKLCRESGACGISLETAKSNEIGNNLYPKVGFKLNDGHNFYDWSV
jgi:ribosomal protein S18 acetylase RimI-like enzyme